MKGMSHTFQDNEGLRVCLNKHAHIFRKKKKKGYERGTGREERKHGEGRGQ